MKLNKEKFLKTELGSGMAECVKAWDYWMDRLTIYTWRERLSMNMKRQERRLRDARPNGKCIKWPLSSSTASNIISAELMSISVSVQKMKQIGCSR